VKNLTSFDFELIYTIHVGLDTQIQEIKESVELPLTHPEYYEEMGIRPPKGVILYGPPGTGKTLLAKAVANQTSATFLRVVGSELIQKYLVSTEYCY
jgi:26S proteasome regulatory subunit T2